MITPTINSKTALVPYFVMAIGSRKVPSAEAIRLIAEQNPVPEALISVGKSSAGYTNCSAAPIVNTKMNPQKQAINTEDGALGTMAKISNGIAAIAYVPFNNTFLGIRSMIKNATIAPKRLKIFKNIVTISSFLMFNADRIVGAKVKSGKMLTQMQTRKCSKTVFFSTDSC